MIKLVAAILLLLSALFAAIAADMLAKREFLDPEGDRADRLLRVLCATCAIAAAFAAGLLL